VRLPRTEVERAGEHRIVPAPQKSRAFEDLRVADRVRKDDPIARVVQPAKTPPRPRQRSIRFAVAASQSRVNERTGCRIGPAEPDRLTLDPPDNPWVNVVPPVEADSLPVDEPAARPRRGHAESVVLE